jgi:hypothetical protein
MGVFGKITETCGGLLERIKRAWGGLLNYDVLITGLPGSGKTVFWSAILGSLQKFLPEEKNGQFIVLDNSLLPTVYKVEAAEWPDKDNDVIEGKLTISASKKKKMIKIYDCDFNPNQENILDKLERPLNEIDGVFIVIDSTELSGTINSELRAVLDKFAHSLRQMKRIKRLGFILTKKDVFTQVREEERTEKFFEEILRNKCSNFFSQLDAEKIVPQFFWLNAIVTRIDDDGIFRIQKQEKTSSDIDIYRPFYWMLGLRDDRNENKEESH